MSKIAFIGSGNMAGAMVNGLVSRNDALRQQIGCIGGADNTATLLAQRTGITNAPSLAALLGDADLVVLAFKPQHLGAADPALAELTRGKLVISILAGKRLATLAKTVPHARNLVRTMPNTPAAIGAGMTAFCSLQPLSSEDRTAVESLLGAFGEYVAVTEDQMDAVTALSGSGPAYLFEFAAALREAGVAAGLTSEAATKLANQTLLGSARLLASRSVPAEQLRNEVTSPNGTTYAGLQRLEAGGFRALVRETVAAAKQRSEELSQG